MRFIRSASPGIRSTRRVSTTCSSGADQARTGGRSRVSSQPVLTWSSTRVGRTRAGGTGSFRAAPMRGMPGPGEARATEPFWAGTSSPSFAEVSAGWLRSAGERASRSRLLGRFWLAAGGRPPAQAEAGEGDPRSSEEHQACLETRERQGAASLAQVSGAEDSRSSVFGRMRDGVRLAGSGRPRETEKSGSREYGCCASLVHVGPLPGNHTFEPLPPAGSLTSSQSLWPAEYVHRFTRVPPRFQSVARSRSFPQMYRLLAQNRLKC